MNCRFGPKREPAELPPGPSDLVCDLEIGEAGEFTTQLHLFVDDGGAREIVFTVHGTAGPKAVTAQAKP